MQHTLLAEHDPTVQGSVIPLGLQAEKVGRRRSTDIACGSGIRTHLRQAECPDVRILSPQQGGNTFIQRHTEGNETRNILRHLKPEYYF